MFSHDVEGWLPEGESEHPKVTPPRQTDDQQVEARQTADGDAERERPQEPDDKGRQR
jgi:hypothetical protein